MITLDKWRLDPRILLEEIDNALDVGTTKPVVISLGSTQILNSHSTPLTAIAGVVGKTIVIVNSVWDYTHVTTDYSTANGITLSYAGHGGDSLGGRSSFLAGVPFVELTATGSFFSIVNAPGVAGVNLAALRGVPVMLSSDLEPTGGDGELTVTVLYTLI